MLPNIDRMANFNLNRRWLRQFPLLSLRWRLLGATAVHPYTHTPFYPSKLLPNPIQYRGGWLNYVLRRPLDIGAVFIAYTKGDNLQIRFISDLACMYTT